MLWDNGSGILRDWQDPRVLQALREIRVRQVLRDRRGNKVCRALPDLRVSPAPPDLRALMEFPDPQAGGLGGAVVQSFDHSLTPPGRSIRRKPSLMKATPITRRATAPAGPRSAHWAWLK